MPLLQSWRWFGPNDPISLQQIKATGIEGIVTSLHHIPYGELWTEDEIMQRKNIVEQAGFTWCVVESVPVYEDIKKRTGNYQLYIENYKQTLRNLGKCGITTVCYNFMPAFDWLRTNLQKQLPDGTYVSEFQMIAIAAFDLFVLKRRGAEQDYTSEQIKQAEEWYKKLSESELNQLMQTLLLSLPGTDKPLTLEFIATSIEEYRNISSQQFKENLLLFIKEIAPVAEENGIRLAVHPDDPPRPVFGLPRVVSSIDDLRDIINAYPSIYNGITLCTGSLGAGFHNNCTTIAGELAPYVHFAHLRNVMRDPLGNFQEVSLFHGDVDIPSVMKMLILEEEKRKKQGRNDWQIPLRPDHGNLMLDDIGRKYYPGYSLYGRLKNIAELRGLEKGMRYAMGL
ncbi:MAG TPA: mannonate dehydratase [Bacteroidales bacterium]|nr:mannonate dehydratase [Bacteroidales bacterium]HPO66280.1 mannonate dehydratase [Bacteroidales bacterium]